MNSKIPTWPNGRIFHHVFGDTEHAHTADLTPALFLIGDPKQAIYGFRGERTYTYLAAAACAPNARRRWAVTCASVPCYCVPLKHCIPKPAMQPFLTPGIAFHPVQPRHPLPRYRPQQRPGSRTRVTSVASPTAIGQHRQGQTQSPGMPMPRAPCAPMPASMPFTNGLPTHRPGAPC